MSQASDLQIDWIRSFLAVVDCGSFTAAAREVSRSQSAVSMQLRKLEASVGREPIDRRSRSLQLTPAGLDLMDHARKLLAAHSDALIAMHGERITGTVSIGAPDDYAVARLAPVLRSFTARFTDIRVTFECAASDRLLQRIERGDLDLALLTRDKPGRGGSFSSRKT